MNAIVLVDREWGIGRGGVQIPSFKEDRKQFRLLTGSPKAAERGYRRIVVMGRKTFEGDLGGKPLKDRVNVVLTREKQYCLLHPGVYSISDPMSVVDIANAYECTEDMVWCIGGESVYQLYFELEMIDKVFVTMIDARYDCDRHFLRLDKEKNGFRFSFGLGENEWRASEDTGILYRMCCYERKKW